MTAGNLYPVAGTGTYADSGDGGPATAAALADPAWIAFDQAGDMAIAERSGNRIRWVGGSTPPVVVAPGAPTGLTATPGDTTVHLSWASSTIGGTPADYVVDEYTGSTVTGSPTVIDTHSTNLSTTITGLTDGQAYTFTVTATNAGGASPASNPATATPAPPAPGAPTGLTATPGDTTVALTWSAPTTGPTPSDYLINEYVGSSPTGSVTTIDTHSTNLGATVTGLTDGQAYTFTVTATNAGTAGPASASSTATPTSVAPVAPGAPTSLAAKPGDTTVALIWSAPTTGGAPSNYVVDQYVGTTTTAAPTVIDTHSTNLGATVTGLTDGQAYTFTVTATNAGGASPASNPATATPTAPTHQRTGIITTLAGTGGAGFSGDGSAATAATLNVPRGATVDSAGNVFIADTSNNRIRVVAATTGTIFGVSVNPGDIYTIAGTGTAGGAGDGGPATAAQLNSPDGVAIDGQGNLLIADTINNRIRVVAATTGTFYGIAMTAGHIYTVAGTGTEAYSGNGGLATSAAFDHPGSVSVDPAGDLLITDTGNEFIRVVAATSGTKWGVAMVASHIYNVAGNGNYGYGGNAGPASNAAFADPAAVVVDASGDLVIADTDNSRVRVVAAVTGTRYGQSMTAGNIYSIAGTGTYGFSGNGGPATAATFGTVSGVAIDPQGNIAVADVWNDQIRVIAATTSTDDGIAMTAGNLYPVAGTGTYADSGDGGPATAAALADPAWIAFDQAGDMAIAERSGNRIRWVG
ncbi:MAG: fibronectin type III domain-containing protein, partial [Mycobacterium sp.]|uniref:fibronectin type III domain-containing protein n=1 Tax=Mycobacterium sp. TaxID=1785 RepID=UPI001EC7B7EF